MVGSARCPTRKTEHQLLDRTPSVPVAQIVNAADDALHLGDEIGGLVIARFYPELGYTVAPPPPVEQALFA